MQNCSDRRSERWQASECGEGFQESLELLSAAVVHTADGRL
jgi:hypothetical protein